MAGLAVVDDGDVGDADELEFGKIANHGDGFDVEFLMNHEVVTLLSKVLNVRDQNNEETSRLHTALDFCKSQIRYNDLGEDALGNFCSSVRTLLQQMVDVHGEGAEPCYGGDADHRLHPFEIAALVNLIDPEAADDPNDPASQVDECHAVIPSLKRFTDDFLIQDVLPTLKRAREELNLGGNVGEEEEEEEEDIEVAGESIDAPPSVYDPMKEEEGQNDELGRGDYEPMAITTASPTGSPTVSGWGAEVPVKDEEGGGDEPTSSEQ